MTNILYNSLMILKNTNSLAVEEKYYVTDRGETYLALTNNILILEELTLSDYPSYSGSSGSGSSGTSGTSGSGTGTGSSGTSGTSGSVGGTGSSGTSGTSGSVGDTGSSGTSGTSGSVGGSGSSGTSGTSGSVGDTGSSGTSGTSGSVGGTGSSGTSGTSGSVGDTGSSGTSGSSGSSGTSVGTNFACYSWNTNYANLTNAVENFIKWDLENFNSNPAVFELVNSGTVDARIYIKTAGYYEFTSQVHFYDLYGNVDIIVRLNRTDILTGIMTGITLFNDSKFSELTADQLINGTLGIYIDAPGYYTVSVNPSTNTPYPSNSDSTPTRLFIRKI